jgi:hypothetical protein
MKIHPKITVKRVERAARRAQACLDSPGFCIACGGEAEGIEPDARRYECEACGEHGVYGAEELLMMVAI